jgi:hypothetical protein
MAVRIEDVEGVVLLPAQRSAPLRPPAVRPAAAGPVMVGGPRPAAPPVPTAADVLVGVTVRALDAARSAADIGILTGQVAWARLPVPPSVRVRARRAWLTAGYAGARRREALRDRLGSVLDALLPVVVREVLRRVDLTGLVAEYVDLDRVAAGLDVDAVADRLDVDRVVARVDLDRAVDRVDLDRVVGRIDLDEIAARLDLDRILDRVDVDEIAARLDLDPLLERADVVGLARYVVEAIDLPELIRTSTGSMTSDMVRGVRAQGADADEAVERVVDRWLHRRGRRNDPAPGGPR